MPKIVAQGAQLTCSMGDCPSGLQLVPQVVDADAAGVATVNAHQPGANILPFGMCKAIANPAVAAATAAASGTLTPAPCAPVTPAPWTPGAAHVDVDGVPALTEDSSCSCSYGGSITITSAGSKVDAD